MSNYVNVPAWIRQDITAYDIAAINQGGCASGAYMPAVETYTARQTMAEHGDDVLDYIENALGEQAPAIHFGESWGVYTCRIMSLAVELWCSEHEHLENWELDEPVAG